MCNISTSILAADSLTAIGTRTSTGKVMAKFRLALEELNKNDTLTLIKYLIDTLNSQI